MQGPAPAALAGGRRRCLPWTARFIREFLGAFQQTPVTKSVGRVQHNFARLTGHAAGYRACRTPQVHEDATASVFF
jgi:hypothetical protein